MKVLLIDLGGSMPNLAVMKLSAWHKRRGDEVSLNDPIGTPDLVYISCIYSWQKSKALSIARFYESLGAKVELGGYAVSDNMLPEEVEHIKPDYNLYGIDYSMGYTSRGCPRRCPWCLVWRVEGDIRPHSPLEEFIDWRFNKVVLLDPNFLASPTWREVLIKLIAWRMAVNFCQGMDIRLIDRDCARLLAKVRYYNHNFTARQLHFSFDQLEMEDDVRKGVRVLKEAGIPARNMMFYMLVGYNTSFDDDMRRFEVLR